MIQTEKPRVSLPGGRCGRRGHIEELGVAPLVLHLITMDKSETKTDEERDGEDGRLHLEEELAPGVTLSLYRLRLRVISTIVSVSTFSFGLTQFLTMTINFHFP